MSVQARLNINTRPLILAGYPVAVRKDDATIEQDAGRSAVLASKTLMSRKLFALATTGTADGGNTGDGTVTAVAKLADGEALKIGDYNLEATAVGVDGRVVGSVTADPGNTGNGTVTGLALVAGEFPPVGDWILTCTDANAGGGATSTSVTITGTGDGVPGSVTPGADVVEGLYTLTCVEAVADKGRFEVADPNGNRLEDLNVTVAYSNSHFALTVADGSADYIVGDTLTFTITIAHGGLFTLTDPDGVDVKTDIVLPGTTLGTVVVTSGGITFTITDGATDFADDDFFTLVVAAAEGGVFKLEDPDGGLVASGLTLSGVPLGATTFNEGGMTFTITDGATDFASGDSFAITVITNLKWVPYDPAGLLGEAIPKGIYDPQGDLGDITAAALVAADITDMPILIAGARFDKNMLVIENSGALTDIVPGTSLTVEEYMRTLSLIAEDTIAGSSAENA